MSQMSPLDGIFLGMETVQTPAHVGGLAVLDPSTNEKFDFNHFRDFVAERIALCPRFGWRVLEVPLGLDLPYWIDDEALDFNEHVHRTALPSPGGVEELSELTGHLYAMPLERSRPLWEMYLIEGLQGGRVALLWKVHHCLMDGQSGASLMELLFDISPEPRSRLTAASEALDPRDAGEVAATSAPSWDEMLGRSLRNGLKRNAKLAETFVSAVGSALTRTGNGETKEEVSATPRTIFNGNVGSRRAVAWTSIPIEPVKAIKSELGVTVNDVILGLTGGAVRNYLDQQGELPEAPLKAMVPVSTRKQGDTSVGNQICDITVDWGTDIAHPVERILRIHNATTHAKEEVAKGGSALMTTLAEGLPPAVHRMIVQAGVAFTDRMPLPANAVVSNVRMPGMPFYIAGAKITQTIPISVLAPTQGLNITAISYCDEIFFGITADPRLVSDPWIIAEGTSKALLELQAAMKEWSSDVR